MPDVFTPAKRSEVMSRIRSTGNAATELRLVALLRAEKITGWRRHVALALPHTRLRSSPATATETTATSAAASSNSRKGAGTGTASHLRTAPPTTQATAKANAKAAGKKTAATAKAQPKKPRVRPDFVFRAERLVIFVDGCFWHGCPTHGTRPRQNRKFWDEKIARNRRRDRHVTRALKKTGWTVLRLWECALSKKRLARTLARVKQALGK